MSETLLQVIKEKSESMSKGHRRIAGYILEHYDIAAFMTAAKIGAKVGISESTVVRFAYELGFAGYPEFQKSLQDLVRKKLTDVQRIDILSEDAKSSDIIEKIFKDDINSIEDTLSDLDRHAFEESADAICRARRIYILGVRSASVIASFLEYYFKLIFDNVVLVDVSSDSEIYEYLFRITDEDVCIVTSFPRYSRNMVNAVKFAHDRRAKVVSVTDSFDSPLAPYSDYLLTAKSAMVSVVDSLTAPMCLANALICMLTLKMKDRVRDNFVTLEEFWYKYDVYDDPEEIKR